MKRVHAAFAEMRRAAAPEPDYEECKRIHELIRCPYEVHAKVKAKLVDCVGDVALLPKSKQRAAIRARRKRNDELRDELNERAAEHHARMKEMVDEYVDEAARERAMAILSSVVLRGADGRMKPLVDFTRGDVRRHRKLSGSQAQAWQARLSFFDQAREELKAANVETVRDLPPDRFAALSETAEAARKDRERTDENVPAAARSA
jgi:hypothetical protein